MKNARKRKKQHLFLRSLILFVLVIAILFGVMVSRVYPASEEAVQVMAAGQPVTGAACASGLTVFEPVISTGVGIVFYPGALVDTKAYAPLMQALADRGLLCVLADMPLHMAFMDANAACAVPPMFPEISHWYVAGHSLGGTMAGTCVASHPELFEGAILLASYTTADLTRSRVLSVYGTNDEVLSTDRYAQYLKYLPSDMTEVVLMGGCHSYFADYGMQQGDGTPTISRENQLTATADACAAFVKGQ